MSKQKICIICQDEIKVAYVFHKTRRQRHHICQSCFEEYSRDFLSVMTKKLRLGLKPALVIPCPGNIYGAQRNKCRFCWDLQELPETLDITRLLYASIMPNMKICSCGNLLEIDTDYRFDMIECKLCSATWCRKCGAEPYHVAKTCLEHELEDTKTEDGKYISKLLEEGALKPCPSCGIVLGKDGGCNKITCFSCHVKWCWLCGEANIDYDHFNPKNQGKCSNRLWEKVDL